MNREEAIKELYKWLTEYYNKIYSKKDLTNDKKYVSQDKRKGKL